MDVLFAQEGGLGIITLNRPQALNALTLSMIKAIQDQLIVWRNNSTIYAVILTAAPGKAFCAGGDVRWLFESGKNNSSQQMEFFKHEYHLNYYIYSYPKPFIALMDGITMGGGVGVSMHGSYPVASENFRFAMPETGIGFFPDIGASYLLSRCPDSLGEYLGLTGDILGPQEALAAGLVKYIVHSERMLDIKNQLSQIDLSYNAKDKIDSYLQQITIKESNSPEKLNYSLIADVFSQSSIEQILEKLSHNDSEDAQQLLRKLEFKSPLSLKITFEQMKRAKKLNLAACLEMDYVLVKHFMKDHDFYEGVRALLIDKDKSPQWKPARLSLISDELLAKYFEYTGTDRLNLG